MKKCKLWLSTAPMIKPKLVDAVVDKENKIIYVSKDIFKIKEVK